MGLAGHDAGHDYDLPCSPWPRCCLGCGPGRGRRCCSDRGKRPRHRRHWGWWPTPGPRPVRRRKTCSSSTRSRPIVYHFKDGSNQWWTAVQIRNRRFGIAGFEYLDGTGQWQSVPRLDYNYFVAASGMGPGPYTFRVTDVNGATLEDSGVALTPDGDCVGTNQFPDCPST